MLSFMTALILWISCGQNLQVDALLEAVTKGRGAICKSHCLAYDVMQLRIRGGGGDTEDDMMRLGSEVARGAKSQKHALSVAKDSDDKWMKKFMAVYLDLLPAEEKAASKERIQARIKQFKSRVKAGSLKNVKQSWPEGWTHPWSADQLQSQLTPQGACEIVVHFPSADLPSFNAAVQRAGELGASSSEAKKPVRIMVEGSNHTLNNNTCLIGEETAAEIQIEGVPGETSTQLIGELDLGTHSLGSLTAVTLLWASDCEVDATMTVNGGPWTLWNCEILAHGSTAVHSSFNADVMLCASRIGGRDGVGLAAACGLLAQGGVTKLLQCDIEDVGGLANEAAAEYEEPGDEEETWGVGAVSCGGAAVVCLVRCLFDRVALALCASSYGRCSLLECEVRMLGRLPAVAALGRRNHATAALVRNTVLASELCSARRDRPREVLELDNVLKPPGWTLDGRRARSPV